MIPSAALLFAFGTLLRGAAVDGSIVEHAVYPLPAFEDNPSIATYASLQDYQEAAADKSFVLEKLRYRSDGIAVVAYLYHPAGRPASKLPVIVFNRGSYVVKDQALALLTMFRRLAREGFTIVAPMYPGSDGAPGHDELGGADLNDLKNIIPVIKALDFADGQNVFLYGESRGAIMTFLALRDAFPARAAATFGGITDLGAYLGKDARAKQMANVIWPDYEMNSARILQARSAIEWAEKINTPILLMHGGADPQVDPVHTLNLAMRLQRLQKEYGLVIFAGDNHIVSKHREERDRQDAVWFRERLSKLMLPQTVVNESSRTRCS